MPRLKIKFSDGSGQEISFKGELVAIEILDIPPKPPDFTFYGWENLDKKEKVIKNLSNGDKLIETNEEIINSGGIKQKRILQKSYLSLPSMLGHWKTNEHFHIEIYELKDSLWLGRCKDCGGGKDKLIYDLNGDPVNYPEFGKLMNRLDMSESFKG